MLRNVAQKIRVKAWITATNAPKTGDAANLTAFVKQDGGAKIQLAGVATEDDATDEKGWYTFDVSATECNAYNLAFTSKSSTPGVECLVVPAVVDTELSNYAFAEFRLPTQFTIPPSGTLTMQGRVYVKNAAGGYILPDSTPTLTVANGAGADRSINLSLLDDDPGSGRYDFTYTVDSGHAAEQLVFELTVVVGGEVRYGAVTVMMVAANTGSGAVVAGAGYVGDFADDDTVIIPFTTSYNGVLTTPVGMTVVVAKDGETFQVDGAGVTLTTEPGGTPGTGYVTVATSGVAFFATGHDYRVAVDDGTVGGVDVSGAVLGSFSLENRPGGTGGLTDDQDEALSEILARVQGGAVEVVAAVEADGTTTIYQGDDYTNGVLGDRRLTYTVEGFTGDINGATVQWKLIPRDRYDRDGSAPAELTIAGTVSQASTTLTFKVPVTAAQSGALTKATSADSPNYVVQLTLVGSGQERLTRLLADATVRKRIS